MSRPSEKADAAIRASWANNLGCSPEELFSSPLRVVSHSPAWTDYHGVFALFGDIGAVASIPAEHASRLGPLLSPLSHERVTPELLANALAPVAARIMGVARVGYAEAVPQPEHSARALDSADLPVLDTLQGACDPDEWAHGGSSLGRPCSGVFVDDQLAAVAGYDRWHPGIADVYVVTHPAFRGRGYGRSAVAHLAGCALAAGLLPQYRTLASNRPSVRLAEQLGFHPYAASVSVRLNHSV